MKSWSCVVVKPDGLYPDAPAAAEQADELKAIAAALNLRRTSSSHRLRPRGPTESVRNPRHFGYRGRVLRGVFTRRIRSLSTSVRR